MLRCLSKFGQLSTRPSFHKCVQIKRPQFNVALRPTFARNYSDLPFSKRYGKKTEEDFAYPKQSEPEDFSFINSGLFAGEGGFFAPTEDFSKKEYKNCYELIEYFNTNYLTPFSIGHQWTIDGVFLKDGQYIKDSIENDELDEDFEIEDPEETQKFLQRLYQQTIPYYHITDKVFPKRQLVYPMVKDSDETDGDVVRFMIIQASKQSIHYIEYDTVLNKETADSIIQVPSNWWIHFKKVRWPKGITINWDLMVDDLMVQKFKKSDQLYESFKRDFGKQKYRRVDMLLDSMEEGNLEDAVEEGNAEESSAVAEEGAEEAVEEEVEEEVDMKDLEAMLEEEVTLEEEQVKKNKKL